MGLYMVFASSKELSLPPVLFPPPQSPYKHAIAAVGIVEAASDNIYIGTPFTEIIEKVYVDDGDWVKKDDPLFTLSTETLQAQLAQALGALEAAQITYNKTRALPRPEEVSPQVAVLKQAEARYHDYEKRFDIVEKIKDPKAVSRDEFNQREYAAHLAKYQLDEAQKKLDLLLAGAWVYDIENACAQVKQAKAAVDVIASRIERSTIRAPFDGQVLSSSITEGELAVALELTEPLMIFGGKGSYQVLVQVDEEEVWRVIEGAPGMAFIRGNSALCSSLTYLYLTPYLRPKTSLTGDNRELVDTRVLEISYECDCPGLPMYPGMIVDVFIEAKPHRSLDKEQK